MIRSSSPGRALKNELLLVPIEVVPFGLYALSIKRPGRNNPLKMKQLKLKRTNFDRGVSGEKIGLDIP